MYFFFNSGGISGGTLNSWGISGGISGGTYF